MNTLFFILFYSLLAGFATIAGLLIVLWQEKWARKNSIYLISLAAGVLITTALLNLLPESLKLLPLQDNIWLSPFFSLIIGFGLFYVIEQLIVIHTCVEENCETHTFGIVAALGIGFHSLIDGIVIGVGFELDYRIGLISSLAVIVHELPEGIFTLGFLLHANMSLKKAVIYTTAVALATPLGAILTYVFIKDVPQTLLGYILAIAAGSFLYIGASDLIPQTHKVSRKASALLVVLGALFVILITNYIPHSG